MGAFCAEFVVGYFVPVVPDLQRAIEGSEQEVFDGFADIRVAKFEPDGGVGL